MRTRKEYLLLRSGKKGAEDMAGVFSSRKKALEAVATDARGLSHSPEALLEYTRDGARLVAPNGKRTTWRVTAVKEDVLLSRENSVLDKNL